MKKFKFKLILILLLFTTSLYSQPPVGDKRNPNAGNNGNCSTCNPVPISYEWVLIIGGVILFSLKHKSKIIKHND